MSKKIHDSVTDCYNLKAFTAFFQQKIQKFENISNPI